MTYTDKPAGWAWRRDVHRFVRRLALVLALCAVIGALAACGAGAGGTVPALYPSGVVAGADGSVQPLPASSDAQYLPGTSFLRSASDDGPSGSDPSDDDPSDDDPSDDDPGDAKGVDAQGKPVPQALVEESRAWLAAGTVPGESGRERDLAERALLDLRLLTQDNGALLAGWRSPWKYVWPRDSSFVVAAYAATGHPAEARQVLEFLAGIAPTDGFWHARYLPTGSGPTADGRAAQLDGAGWVLWGTWQWYVSDPDLVGATALLQRLWPMVAASASAAVRSLQANGLPVNSSDYLEQRELTVTLGTAAPLLAGLRAAADLAGRLGRTAERTTWGAAAGRLDAGISATFARKGYGRTVTGGGADTAVTFLAPPFGPASTALADAVRTSLRTLTQPGGGVKPVERWRRTGESWTPETAMFALASVGLGNLDSARTLLAWIAAHRTKPGAIPEQVNADGEPRSVAPLSWTNAIVVLTLSAMQRPLPVPPVP